MLKKASCYWLCGFNFLLMWLSGKNFAYRWVFVKTIYLAFLALCIIDSNLSNTFIIKCVSAIELDLDLFIRILNNPMRYKGLCCF